MKKARRYTITLVNQNGERKTGAVTTFHNLHKYKDFIDFGEGCARLKTFFGFDKTDDICLIDWDEMPPYWKEPLPDD